jgi:ubiquinone/menaquinone biosynthesis C-methylase UbiE
MSEDNLTSEKYWVNQREISGSTRVPIEELREFGSNKIGDGKKVILDLGSGEGRSTSTLQSFFPEAKIIAFDLSREGLKKTALEATGRVQGTILELPFGNESADGIVLCGVMTNIADKDPNEAINARKKALKEVARVLKQGGVCVISDFNSEHELSNYSVNYFRHQLITGEYGTIAVFDPSAKITFRGRSDDDIALLAKSPYLQRFAHHYSPKELMDLIESQKELKIIKYSVEIGRTPSGNPIDTIVMSFKKITDLG